MTSCQTAGGEQCPACGESDLRPYGNGSKWVCPRCYFIVPCCEGGGLSAAGPGRGGGWAKDGGGRRTGAGAERGGGNG